MRYFPRTHRCIIYAARGYRPSDVPKAPEAYSYKHFMSDVIAMLDHLGIAKAHLVGLSMGGYSVLQVGLNHPERALSLTMAGTGSGSERWFTEEFRRGAEALAKDYETTGSEAVARSYGVGARPHLVCGEGSARARTLCRTARRSRCPGRGQHHARLSGRPPLALRLRGRNPPAGRAEPDRGRRRGRPLRRAEPGSQRLDFALRFHRCFRRPAMSSISRSRRCSTRRSPNFSPASRPAAGTRATRARCARRGRTRAHGVVGADAPATRPRSCRPPIAAALSPSTSLNTSSVFAPSIGAAGGRPAFLGHHRSRKARRQIALAAGMGRPARTADLPPTAADRSAKRQARCDTRPSTPRCCGSARRARPCSARACAVRSAPNSASRCMKRAPSSAAKSTPLLCSSCAISALRSSASTSAFHCRRVTATIIARRPSAVAKSRPKVPNTALPERGRSRPLVSTSAIWPRLAERGKSNIRQRQADFAALAAAPALPVGRQERHSGRQPGGYIPGRQHMIDRPIAAFRPGQIGISGRAIDGVVDRRAPVARSGDAHGDQVRTAAPPAAHARESPRPDNW